MRTLAKRLDTVCKAYTDAYGGNVNVCETAIKYEPEKVIEFLVCVMETSLEKMIKESKR